MRSISRTLLAWILGALALGAVLVVLITYRVTLDEMNEVFDSELEAVATAMASLPPPQAGTVVRRERSDAPKDVDILTLIWTPQGELTYSSDARVEFPFVPTAGARRQLVGQDEWIVHTAIQPHSVAVAAQRVSNRHEMAGESALTVVLPMLVLVAVVAALLSFGLRRGLRPLRLAARNVASRSATSLEPVPMDRIPEEIAPLVTAINELMARLSVSFSSQQQFLADAAHELRTPVAALRLQLQMLKLTTNPRWRDEAIRALQQGIDRSQRLIEQLMLVARTGPDGDITRKENLDLGDVVRRVVTDLNAQAEQRQIDLGANVAGVITLRGDRDQLTSLLTNLVENALRYTPAGGVVDVDASLQSHQPMLRVIDNGPGIAPAERERVFDRFYRGPSSVAPAEEVPGSGLGLAIVRAIAQRHGAKVSLHSPANGRGLEVCVAFPRPVA